MPQQQRHNHCPPLAKPAIWFLPVYSRHQLPFIQLLMASSSFANLSATPRRSTVLTASSARYEHPRPSQPSSLTRSARVNFFRSLRHPLPYRWAQRHGNLLQMLRGLRTLRYRRIAKDHYACLSNRRLIRKQSVALFPASAH